MITYKFRLYPNKKQQSKMWLHANKLNWLYNQFLSMKIDKYKNEKINLSRNDLQSMIPELKENDEILKEIYSQVIQQVTYRLDRTYKDFFRRGWGFPKFRSCKNFFGICYPQSGYSIQGNIFHTKIYGDIEFNGHREIYGNIKTVTIKSEGRNWFICITTDYEYRKEEREEIIGIDVGISNLAALSNGEIIRNKTHSKYFDRQINELKSRRDKCTKHSRKFRCLDKVVQRLYGVKNRKINDFQHKVSKNLSGRFDTIVIEDLNLKSMSESEIIGLNRELRNSKIASFINKLNYKVNYIVEVNPKNTSKTCNSCGKIKSMPLCERTYECECGYKEDRDVNAAKNILCLGQAILLGECTVESSIQEALCFS